MLVVVHLFTGAALGAVLKEPIWLVLVLAVVLHLVLDLVPHWDYTETHYKDLAGFIDVGMTAALALIAYKGLGLPSIVIWAGIVSALPDLDSLNALLPTKKRFRVFPSHMNGFPHGKADTLGGIVGQVVLVVASVTIIYGYI